MSGQEKKLNASQRLETLEVNNQELLMHLNNFSRDLSMIKDAIKLLGSKVDAVQKASNISDEVVAGLMIDNNINELKEKVEGFLKNGTLVLATEVTDQTFVVGKEVDDDGKVANPRIQFAVGALQPELKEKIVGAKVGDKVQFSDGTLLLEVEEIYAIVVPQQADDQNAEA